MDKVSIGLRGWRFDESDVFDDGDLRPIEEMPADARERVLRLTALVGSPCDACWLIHGDEDLAACKAAAAVYGEPLAEVVLCAEHETDFLYWFREAGGERHRGTEELQDAFHGWFADGGRAPEGYGGVEHVDTDPGGVPTPEIDWNALAADASPEEDYRIDLREYGPDDGSESAGDGKDDRESPPPENGEGDPDSSGGEEEPVSLDGVDLDVDYPKG